MDDKKLSLCMIVKNEERWIQRCLSSVKDVVDEMIVVDTGSTDRTPEIARSLGATVYSYPWTEHFADARNYGIERATGDWILWLDADEEVDAADAPRLRDVLDSDRDLVFIELVNFHGASPPHPDRVNRLAHHRLFRNHIGFRFRGAIHEQLNIKDVLGELTEMFSLDVRIYHYGYMDSEVGAKAKSERNLAMLSKAAAEPDADPWIEYHLASEYYRVEEFRLAFEHVNISIRKFLEQNQLPPALLYKLKYSALLSLGSFAGAWPAIDSAIALYPDYVDLHFYKGLTLLYLDRAEEAIDVFRRCLELGEDNLGYLTLKGLGSFQAWYFIGRSYEKLEKTEEAIEAYSKALELSPDHSEASEAYSRLNSPTKTTAGRMSETAMITISLCMIVRDEEATLDRVLRSVRGIADEINIVDTGSVDNTKEIARRYTDRIFDFQWCDDFAAARNFSFSKATKEYILWLDADDIIAEEDRKRFKKLKKTLPKTIDRVTMPYNLAFDGDGKVTSSLRRNRLVRRDRQFSWIGPVHEYLSAFGPFLDSDVCITHSKQKAYTNRNLRIYQQRRDAGEEFTVRDLYYFANELKDHSFNEEAVDYYDRMLKTGQGWIEDNIQACLKMAECYNRMGNKEKRFESLTRALAFEKPRSELSLEIGAYFFDEAQYETAIFWYGLAADTPRSTTMGMSNLAASTWLPQLQLCLCYDRLGQFKKAYEHNEKALAFHPTHPSLLYNRNYFRDTHKFGEPT